MKLVWILVQLTDHDSWPTIGVFSSEKTLLDHVEALFIKIDPRLQAQYKDLRALRYILDEQPPAPCNEHKFVIIRDGKAVLRDRKEEHQSVEG